MLVFQSNNLVDQLSQVLATQIVSGERALGSRLPTEEQLANEVGVSRTVVREAIARLKADGLVTTRQGLGAFVSESLMGTPFRFDHEQHDVNKIVQDVFELRIGIETEAAALAAERATNKQIKEIAAALKTLEKTSGSGAYGVDEDLMFHRAIARATNNSAYNEMVGFLERYTKNQLTITRRNSDVSGWLQNIHYEHEAIYQAIAAHDPDAARKAAHAHLRSGMDRLKRFQSE
ncbi:MAG TPA: FadR/GntR family transcriptional regulator [Eoetvoesiella sp.]